MSLTAPITRSLIGELIPFEDSPADEPRMKRSNVIRSLFRGKLGTLRERKGLELIFVFFLFGSLIFFFFFFLVKFTINRSKNVFKSMFDN